MKPRTRTRLDRDGRGVRDDRAGKPLADLAPPVQLTSAEATAIANALSRGDYAEASTIADRAAKRQRGDSLTEAEQRAQMQASLAGNWRGR